MNPSKRIAICLFAGLLMTLGQPRQVVPTASAAPQLLGCQQCGARSGCRCRARHQRQGCVQCPECTESFVPPAEEYCELDIKPGKTEKTCFEIDYKTICIPKVIPPWRQGCEPQCAEARSVKILKKRKYTCPTCNYRWNVVKPPLPAVPQPCAPVVPADAYYHQVPQSSATGAGDYYSPPAPHRVQPATPWQPAATNRPLPQAPAVRPAPGTPGYLPLGPSGKLTSGQPSTPPPLRRSHGGSLGDQ